MKYLEVMRSVGKYPVAIGFWRNVSIAIGFIGIMALLFLAGFMKIGFNWPMLILILIFSVMMMLPVYLPGRGKTQGQKSIK